MKSIFENEKVLRMFKKYIDAEYPLDLFDRYRNTEESMEFKYLMSIDGMTAAWKRPSWIMASESVLFKTTTKFYQWYYDGLIPWVNYIPVRPDVSDLSEKIQWARDNDEIAHQIARNGKKFSDKVFSKEVMNKFILESI